MSGIKHSHIVNHSFLFSGKDLKLTEDVVVKHPTVQEVLDINNGINASERYWNMVSLLVCDPYDNMVMLDDNGMDYENSDCFDVFLCKWDNCIKSYNENKELFGMLNFHPLDAIKTSLSFFIGDYNFDVKEINFKEGADMAIIDINQVVNNQCRFVITREMFNIMSEFLTMMNNMNRSDRIKPANETTKKLLIEDMRDEIAIRGRKKDDEDSSEIHDYIGKLGMALAFGGNGSLSVFDVGKLKIYHLISGFDKSIKKENSGYLKTGIYTGNIDPKQLNKKEMDWIN